MAAALVPIMEEEVEEVVGQILPTRHTLPMFKVTKQVTVRLQFPGMLLPVQEGGHR